MSFFQNPFDEDFVGSLVTGTSMVSGLKVPRNGGRGKSVVTVWAKGPYDLSGNDGDSNSKAVLNIGFAYNDLRYWNNIAVTITASSLASTRPDEIVASLNANVTFTTYFTVATDLFDDGKERISITQKPSVDRFKFYIKNGRAESVLLFNKRAGVAELPTYFNRHTVSQVLNFEDSVNQLILLTPGSSTVETNVINNAVDYRGNALGLSASTVQADYLLLKGKSTDYKFSKTTVDGNTPPRPSVKITYSAGARVGDLAVRTTYTYNTSGATYQIVNETNEPYVLTNSDIITPV